MQFEDAFHEAGTFGKAQKWILFTSIIIHCFSGWPFMVPFLNSDEVEFTCVTEKISEPPILDRKISPSSTTNVSSVKTHDVSDQKEVQEDKSKGHDKELTSSFFTVLYPREPKIATTEPVIPDENAPQCCGTKKYKKEPSNSILSSFDFDCEPYADVFKILVKYAFLVGFILSCFFTGIFADLLGRKTLLIPSILFSLCCSIGLIFAPKIKIYILCQILFGFFQYPMLSQSLLLSIESCTPKHAARIAVTLVTFSTCGFLGAALSSAYIPSWKNQVLVMIGLQSLILVLVFLKVYESARWLFYIGDHKNAESLLRSIASVNGKTAGRIQLTGRPHNLGTQYKEDMFQGDEDELISDEELELDSASMLDSKTVKVHTTSGNCFRLCGTFRTTMLIIFNMLAWVSCFFPMFHFAVIYQTAIESRIKFIVFLSLIKLSSWYISLVINAVGRKYPLLALTFVAMLLHVFLTFMQPHLLPFSIWFLAVFGLEFTFSAQNILVIYSCEILPTQFRSTGLGFFVGFSQISIWGIPLLSIYGYQMDAMLTIAITIGLTLASILLGFIFGLETVKNYMPQTIDQFYQMSKSQRKPKTDLDRA
ncbi:organic anion transporter 3-like [Symsagittifera roscoffensis]|uniref:organic anion transporter 3-like n=1 Tax=Symsagittifera roscoffensis TaxID=84072 RepID=UPI00307B70CB